jgi:predicted metal-dependent TIM-barrel fold hydrolase
VWKQIWELSSKLQEIVLPWANAVGQRINTDGIATNGFEKQLLLAQKYNKPVVIHCVAAFQEVIDTKRD